MHGSPSEIEESIQQVIGFSKLLAISAGSGSVVEMPGLIAPFGNVAIPLLNVVHATSRVRDLADLGRRAAAAVAYATPTGLPWLFGLCDAWLPESGADEIAGVLAEHGLHPAMKLTGMVADALLPPVRPLPEIELRQVDDVASAAAVGDINCVAYGLPLDEGRRSIGNRPFYTGGNLGHLGVVGGTPVSCAATLRVDDALYVALVATAEGHRRRGYCEAVLRRSLADASRATGLSRTVLHATEDGQPLYEQMGYRVTTTFTYYATDH